jgi:FkbM family methyltransferase
MGHTQALVEDSISRVLAYLEKGYSQEVAASSNTQILSPYSLKNRTGQALNKLLGTWGYHLSTTNAMRQLERGGADTNEKLWAAQTYVSVLQKSALFDEAYASLADSASREIYDWCIRVRIALAFVGRGAYLIFPPPMGEETYQKGIAEIQKKIHHFRFEIDGLRLKSAAYTLFTSFRIEQYRLPGLVEPEAGDWVLDIGGLYGETAFWFSKQVGPTGKVFCFEPVSDNFKILLENLRANPTDIIVPENLSVGESSGEILVSGSGGGAAVSNCGQAILCVSIDDYVRDHHLDRVTLVKMDIEGYESNALQGAVETLKRFQPKLAISVYHGGEDLARIPLWIEGLGLGYKMYLGHCTTNIADTILFAIANHRDGTGPSESGSGGSVPSH